MRRRVVAIDGPVGVGKSSVAREVARRLGIPFLETGAMYRALGLRVVEEGLDPGDAPADKAYSGLVRFHDPRGGSYYYEDAGNRRLRPPAHHGTIDYRHEQGGLLLFPSYMTHEIYPYQGERPRIVVAFNCWILGQGDKLRPQTGA